MRPEVHLRLLKARLRYLRYMSIADLGFARMSEEVWQRKINKCRRLIHYYESKGYRDELEP